MSRLLHIVFSLILIAAIGYGGYVAYERWWGGSDVQKKVKEAVQQAQETVEGYAGQSIEQTKKYAEESLEKAKQSAEKKVTETIEDYSKKAVVSAISYVNDKLNNIAQSLVGTSTNINISAPSGTNSGGNSSGGVSSITGSSASALPQPTASTFLIPPPPTTIVIKKNTLLIFSINKEGVYAINWGDGKTEGGENKKKDEVRFVEHSWAQAGDYSTQIILKENEQTNIYAFPVRVYE